MPSSEAILAQMRRCVRNAVNPPPPEDLAELCADWADLLGELDDAQLAVAVREHLLASRFFPAPSDLLERHRTATQQTGPSIEARAEVAFVAAYKARSTGGRDGRERAAALLAHHGITDPAEQAAAVAAIGDWARWDAGDPVNSPAVYSAARRAFRGAFGVMLADVKAGRLPLLPAPPPLRALEYHEEPPPRRLAPPRIDPEPRAAPTPLPKRVWSPAHVQAGLCAEADVGRAVPADYRHPASVRVAKPAVEVVGEVEGG